MTANANLNLLRTRATAFAKDFAKSTYEMGEAQNFIRGLHRPNSHANVLTPPRMKAKP